MKTALFSLLILCLTASYNALGGITPLSVGILPPVQFPPEDFTITGLRVSALWGRHRNVYGIDMGVGGNITEQRFVGIALAGGLNIHQGDTTILFLEAAGLGNFYQGKLHVYGIQFAPLVNRGPQASSIVGLQFALANLADHTDIYGFQVGIYNRAFIVYGFQIGLVNMAESVHGLQIGLLNFHRTGLFSVAPIINFGF